MIDYKKDFNIYYGTVANVKYQYTKKFKSYEDAVNVAKNNATSYYYKYEGKHGLPSFSIISKESEITGLSIESLYEDHINDMMRWYAIPTEEDTIPRKSLKW